MFPRSSEKIIEAIPNAKRAAFGEPRRRRGRGRRRFSAAVLFLLVSPLGARAASTAVPFDRSSFNKIEFSPDCAQKKWTLAPDNTLELMIAPPPHGTCNAALHFYFPQDVRDIEGIAFEARSSQPGLFLRMGVQEPGGEPFYTRSFPRLKTEWVPEGARIGYIKKGYRPQQIATLHFFVISNRRVLLNSWDTITIRNIRFTGSVPAGVLAESPAATMPAEPPAAVPAVQAAVPSASPAPLAPPLKFQWGRVLRTGLEAAVVLLAGSFLYMWISSRHKNRRRRILSPLYEINMRTWKTRRDAEDVVHFGGFNRVTYSDLKKIKQEGFNSIWVMGIWEVGAKIRDISKAYAPDFHGSPFAIYDYTLSSDLGTEQEFDELVRRAHSLRMSVIVDFIPNHMGLDSAWLNDHPEYFIHRVVPPAECGLSDDELKERYPGHFPYRTPSYPSGDRRVPKTLMVAYGKDPYFYPWIDTAQLDYAQPGLRQRMTDVLSYWAKKVDGVRCDMAMLVIREQVKVHRHPDMSWDEFNALMPNEFWTETIQAVKKVNPHFVFLAETYWSMEGALQKLGFDYTYNKPLYEAICTTLHSGHAEGLMNFLRVLGTDFLQRSVHFIENHDEERAMNALGEDRQRAAAAILCTLPGVALVHQGQMEGKRERLPVQRVIPIHAEADHTGLQAFYRRLLKATSLPVFQEGRLTPLYSNNSALISYLRTHEESKVLVVINASSKKQAGSITLMPGLRLTSGTRYRLHDLFYALKSGAAGAQPSYSYPASKLINHGLYVELDPFDAHLFVLNPEGVLETPRRAFHALRHTLHEWPVNRVGRRLLGSAFTRSSDTNLAANPGGRQQ
jgi:glycosidase